VEKIGEARVLRLEAKETTCPWSDVEAESLSALQPGYGDSRPPQLDRPLRRRHLDAEPGRQVERKAGEHDVRRPSDESPQREPWSECRFGDGGAKPTGLLDSQVAHDEGQPRTQGNRGHLCCQPAPSGLSLDSFSRLALDPGARQNEPSRARDGECHATQDQSLGMSSGLRNTAGHEAGGAFPKRRAAVRPQTRSA